MAKQISQSNGTETLSQEAIARRAYEIWQSEGCPNGRAMEHWLRAVSELKRQSNGTQPGPVEKTEEREPEAARLRAPRRAPPRATEKRFQTAGR